MNVVCICDAAPSIHTVLLQERAPGSFCVLTFAAAPGESPEDCILCRGLYPLARFFILACCHVEPDLMSDEAYIYVNHPNLLSNLAVHASAHRSAPIMMQTEVHCD